MCTIAVYAAGGREDGGRGGARRNHLSLITVSYRLSFGPMRRNQLQSNLFNTDTKGTEPSVRFTEVSVL